MWRGSECATWRFPLVAGQASPTPANLHLPMSSRGRHFQEPSFRVLEGFMDRFESMSMLLTVVEAGSLSAAARKLGTPLATVSRKVSELEAHLRSAHQPVEPANHAHRSGAVLRCCLQAHPGGFGGGRARGIGEYSAPKGDLIVTAPIVFGRLHVLPIVSNSSRPIPRSTSGSCWPTAW